VSAPGGIRLVVALALVSSACGGAAFVTGAEPGDGGGAEDAPQAPEAGPEGAQGEDGGQDAGGDVVGHVLGQDGGAVDAGEAGQVAEAAADGGTEAGPHTCVTDLSGVGTGDFRVAFTLTTTSQVDVALLDQMSGCSQSSPAWSVSMSYTGQVAGGTGDGAVAHWVATTEANTVNDGKPHAIVFARTSGKIWISKDGTVDSIPVADPYSIGALPPLRIGTSDCTNFASASTAGVAIANVCISEP